MRDTRGKKVFLRLKDTLIKKNMPENHYLRFLSNNAGRVYCIKPEDRTILS